MKINPAPNSPNGMRSSGKYCATEIISPIGRMLHNVRYEAASIKFERMKKFANNVNLE